MALRCTARRLTLAWQHDATLSCCLRSSIVERGRYASTSAPSPTWLGAAFQRTTFTRHVPRAHQMSSSANSSKSSTLAAPKAAFLVIGDEILRGSVADANTPWLAKLLHAQGVDLIRVLCVPDNIDNIVEALHDLRSRVGADGFIFTSGGIGATHDDVTYAAVARAYELPLERHPPTVDLMQQHYSARGLELNEARLRMATIPTPSEVLRTEGLWVPLVNVNGVYVLPGIPRLFQKMLGAHRHRFKGPQSHDASCYTDMGEGDLAKPLGKIAQEYPAVTIGSYPWTGETPAAYKVEICCTSRDKEALEAAVGAIREAIPCIEK